METTPDLSKIKLGKGAHVNPEAGMCLMEAIAHIQRQPHNDRPICVSPLLGAFGRNVNDLLPDRQRQKLVPLIPLLIGTANDGKDQRRSWIALDWIVRTYMPTFLRLVPALVPIAIELESQAEIVDEATLRLAMDRLTSAQKQSAASRDAAWAASWAASRGAAGAAAWAAAGAASWNASRDAAGDAAGAASWAASWGAARAAAWAASRDASWNAAWDASWAAAGDAARDVLKPTVQQLQESSIKLFERLAVAA